MTNAKFISVVGLFLSILAGCSAPGGLSKSTDQGVDPNYDAANKQRVVKITQSARGAEISVDARVFFDSGKASLKADSSVALDRFATLIKEKTTANVLIEGHTDDVGAAQLNQKLSEQRAESVRGGLVARGVPAARLQSKGLGFSQPVADNKTEDGRAQNRRVNVTLLGETVEHIGGKAEEANLSSGLEKFLANAGEMIRGVFDKITGSDKPKAGEAAK